jgi:hypothetical protein
MAATAAATGSAAQRTSISCDRSPKFAAGSLVSGETTANSGGVIAGCGVSACRPWRWLIGGYWSSCCWLLAISIVTLTTNTQRGNPNPTGWETIGITTRTVPTA